MKHANIVALSGPNTGSLTGAAIDAVELYKASFQASMGDSTGAGSIIIQASNDICNVQYNPSIFVPTNWTVLSTTAFAAGAGSVLIPAFDSSYRWLRVVYTSITPGTSTISVNMFAVAV